MSVTEEKAVELNSPAITTPTEFLRATREILGSESVQVSGSVERHGEAIVCQKLIFFTPSGRLMVGADLKNRPVFVRNGELVNPYDLEKSSMSVRSQLAAAGLRPMNRLTHPPMKIFNALGWTGSILSSVALAGAVGGIGLGAYHPTTTAWGWVIPALITALLPVTLFLGWRYRQNELRAAMISDLHRMGISFIGGFDASGEHAYNHSRTPSGFTTRVPGERSVATARASRDGQVQKVWMMKDHYRFT